MINRAIINLDKAALDKIHACSLEILHDGGIRFPSDKALVIFKKHGFKVDGPMVHFEPEDISQALETVPAAFSIEAGNSRPRRPAAGKAAGRIRETADGRIP
jgi:trimethylamine:corrinoid methyltransferase-like protein